MELVCKENGTENSWFYEEGRYIRKDKHGVMTGRIRGVNLPDPLNIKETREANKRALQDIGRDTNNYRMDADPTTYKLWAHWQASKHVI